MPSKMVPSSSARIAVWFTEIALAARELTPFAQRRRITAAAKHEHGAGPVRNGVQANGNSSDERCRAPAVDRRRSTRPHSGKQQVPQPVAAGGTRGKRGGGMQRA